MSGIEVVKIEVMMEEEDDGSYAMLNSNSMVFHRYGTTNEAPPTGGEQRTDGVAAGLTST